MESFVPNAYRHGLSKIWGNIFVVDEHIYVPRRKTETDVSIVLSRINTILEKSTNGICIVDGGTGSGIILITITLLAPKLGYFYATDIYEDTLELAKVNTKRLMADNIITFLHFNLIADFPSNTDIIVANMPYTTRNEMNYEKSTEPIIARFDDGNTVIVEKLLKIQDLHFSPTTVIFETNPYLVTNLMSKSFRCFDPALKEIVTHKIMITNFGWLNCFGNVFTIPKQNERFI